jgi:hypothetical protein
VQPARAQAPEARDGAGAAVADPPARDEASAGASHERQGAILLVRTRGDARLVRRIRPELDANGWRVLEVGPDPELDAVPLAELAARHSATAAIRVQPARAQVELWMARALGADGGALETLSVPGPRPNERVLALRVTETLRARWLKLGPATTSSDSASVSGPAPAAAESTPRKPTQAQPAADREPAAQRDAEPDAPAAPRGRETPPKRERTQAPEKRPEADASEAQAREAEEDEEPEPENAAPVAPLRVPQLWLELAPALALSPGGVGPGLDVWASARLQLGSDWSLAALAIVPVWSAPMEEPEGSARVRMLMLGGAADYLLGARAWQLSAGLGVASLLSLMSGTTEPPFDGKDVIVPAVGPFARAALHLDLTGGLRLCARALVGASFPEIRVRFAERDAARWGRPFFVATLGIELPLLGDPR